MPRKTPAELQAEETASSSPLRRSSRVTAGRRLSTDSESSIPQKVTRSRRASQDEIASNPPKPATRIRRVSSLMEEQETGETDVKKRTTRQVAKKEPEPINKPVTRRRTSTSSEPEEVKAPVATRKRRTSTDSVEKSDTKVEEPVRRTSRGRRPSVEKDEEPSDAKTSKVVVRNRRRLSVTENVTKMEAIEEQRKESSPVKEEKQSENLNLSVVKEEDDAPPKKSPKLATQPEKESLNDISEGSDGSFRFNLNVSVPSTEEAILNDSKTSSNNSDKENSPVKQVNEIVDVFKPKMKDFSFCEPMDVDITINQSQINLDETNISTKETPKEKKSRLSLRKSVDKNLIVQVDNFKNEKITGSDSDMEELKIDGEDRNSSDEINESLANEKKLMEVKNKSPEKEIVDSCSLVKENSVINASPEKPSPEKVVSDVESITDSKTVKELQVDLVNFPIEEMADTESSFVSSVESPLKLPSTNSNSDGSPDKKGKGSPSKELQVDLVKETFETEEKKSLNKSTQELVKDEDENESNAKQRVSSGIFSADEDDQMNNSVETRSAAKKRASLSPLTKKEDGTSKSSPEKQSSPKKEISFIEESEKVSSRSPTSSASINGEDKKGVKESPRTRSSLRNKNSVSPTKSDELDESRKSDIIESPKLLKRVSSGIVPEIDEEDLENVKTRVSLKNKESISPVVSKEEISDEKTSARKKSPVKLVKTPVSAKKRASLIPVMDKSVSESPTKSPVKEEAKESITISKSPSKSRDSLSAAPKDENEERKPKRESLPISKIEQEDENEEKPVLVNISPEASAKLDKLLENLIESDDDDEDDQSSNPANEYIDDMCEEGEEDTPSEDSNQIIDEGESIHSTDTEEREHDDDDYENDSFVCDDEVQELLSGEEYDLEDGEEEKSKKSRIIQIDDDYDSDVIVIPRKKKEENQVVKKGRIAQRPVDEMDDDVEDIVPETESKIQILENITITEPHEIENVFNEEEKVEVVESVKRRSSSKRTSSISILENIKVEDLKEADIGERISDIVETFVNNKNKGEISMNLSLEYAEVSSDDSEKVEPVKLQPLPKERKRKSDEGEKKGPSESPAIKKRKSNEYENKIKRRSLSESRDESVRNSELLNERRLSRSVEKLPIKKNKAKKKQKKQVDDLRTGTFNMFDQLITEERRNRPVRQILPTKRVDNLNMWKIETLDVKPSTSSVTKEEREFFEKVEKKFHAKDFKNQMLYDAKRVKRVDTKKLLKKKGAF